jgi:DNA-binding NarL/FixJ family response regulator
VVEDGRLLRDTLRRLVDREPDLSCGLAVATCEEMFDALDSGDRPGLVLVDLSLPGASGVEATARLRAQVPACPVIVLTVHEDDEHVFDAISAGAIGYLIKPSSPEQVIGAVREALAGGAPINPHVGRRILGFFSRLPARSTGGVDQYGLTSRESEVLRLAVEGLDKPAIARRLGLSYHTVSNHLRKVYGKVHVTRRSQAVAKAVREDLV